MEPLWDSTFKHMDLSTTLRCVVVAMMMAAPFTALGASIAGTVKDAEGKPLENARVDHTGKR